MGEELLIPGFFFRAAGFVLALSFFPGLCLLPISFKLAFIWSISVFSLAVGGTETQLLSNPLIIFSFQGLKLSPFALQEFLFGIFFASILLVVFYTAACLSHILAGIIAPEKEKNVAAVSLQKFRLFAFIFLLWVWVVVLDLKTGEEFIETVFLFASTPFGILEPFFASGVEGSFLPVLVFCGRVIFSTVLIIGLPIFIFMFLVDFTFALLNRYLPKCFNEAEYLMIRIPVLICLLVISIFPLRTHFNRLQGQMNEFAGEVIMGAND